jgi:hypothetical protein
LADNRPVKVYRHPFFLPADIQVSKKKECKDGGAQQEWEGNAPVTFLM